MMFPIQKFLESVTVEASTPEQLDRNALLSRLEKHSFALVRGLISPQEILRVKENLLHNFDPSRDRPAVGEAPEEVMGLFQKISVGSELRNKNLFVHGKQLPKMQRPRFMRALYTPFWEKDVYGLHSMLRKVCRVRNLLYGFPLDFCIDQREGDLWTAARIHHYPAGGGFLCAHRDEVLPKVNDEKGLVSYYQPFLMMSQKGKDFEEGGGFVELDGERFFFEEHCRLGDIGIYDGRTLHGVQDIDPHKKLNLNSLEGRMAAFVSLYKDLRKTP